MMKLLFAVASVALCLVSAQDTATQTILRTIRNSQDHQVFSRLLPAAKPPLDRRLGNPNLQSTVFAPTDDAFSKLIFFLTGTSPATPDDTVRVLETVIPQLDAIAAVTPGVPTFSQIIYYHMRFGRHRLVPRLEGTSFKTGYRGFNLTYTTDQKIKDIGSDDPISITTPNLRHVNGFLNIIGDVLLPINASAARDALFPPVPPSPSDTAVASPSVNGSILPISPVPSPSTIAGVTPPSSPVASGTPAATPASPSPPDTDGGDGDDGEATPEPTAPAGDDDEDDGVCFPASARVTLADGSIVRMDELTSSHQVAHNAAKQSSRVFLFTHRSPAKRARFVRLSTSCGQSLTLTASHYIRAAEGHVVAAGDVKVGQTKVATMEGACTITKSESVPGVGLYAPHSMHGDLVVDGVVVSGYSKAVHPALAHAMLFPVRWVAKMFAVKEPLGSSFYNGADWALKFLPRGRDVHSVV